MASPVKVRVPAHPLRPGATSLRPTTSDKGTPDSPSGKFTGRKPNGNYDNAVDVQHPLRMSATSYGPPWEGIQGTGITAGGTNLKDGHKAYIIAADPSVLPLGTEVYVHPNPFGYKGRFLVDDTGGGIKGNRIDFYDWRGRAAQRAWGRRNVEVVKVLAGDFNPDPTAIDKVGDALSSPFAALNAFFKLALSLFYPATWVRIGLVVLGMILFVMGLHFFFKSLGVNVPRATARRVGAIAVASKLAR